VSSALDRINLPAQRTGPVTIAPPGTNFTHHPDYDGLPDAIKAIVTPKEYAWMSNQQRVDLLMDICEPDEEG
jgi:hypothetical protein